MENINYDYTEVISFNVKNVNRNQGDSVVEKAAYQARDKLYSKELGRTFNYTKLSDLVFHDVFIPLNAPSEYKDSEILWNAVEMVENRKNSRLAKRLIISIPKEFNLTDQISLVKEYVQNEFVKKGMCADVAIHDKGDGNPHVHILLTTRSMDENGKWMKKQQGVYLLDKNGNKILDPTTGRYKFATSIKINDWEKYGIIEEWRKSWAELCNRKFYECGIDKKLTHKSYKRQGVNREATKHLGARAKARIRQGKTVTREEDNKSIRFRNSIRDKQKLRQSIQRHRTQEMLIELIRSR